MNAPPVAPSEDRPAPLQRTGLVEQVREFIVDGISSGRWQPGERIVERRVAVELGVSQGPVREALRLLETLRLIESLPNRGARVRPFGERELAEIFPVRAGLERTAVELALPRLAGHLDELEAQNARLAEAARAGDLDEQIRESIHFHRLVVGHSGNQLLTSVWEGLGIEVWTTLSLRLHRTEIYSKSAEHARIIDAFRRQDPSAAQMLHDHVMNYAPLTCRPS
ncbi:GntR family transcriptional regulator [Actinomadura rupiterrae]|uniref:GntR family transcriptional regulator n=1 Tax=Actinomadura rupiterrae TaxID=559627 RepID=UPI0020A2C3A8|nr:GntR family transcriptional regulator [Actinomadura rupiterrae]MCP2335942.1 DNA-binding GntR family transcriptional regulator [Actinomadura rupiterrae]